MEDQLGAPEDKVVDMVLNHLGDSDLIWAFCNHQYM